MCMFSSIPGYNYFEVKKNGLPKEFTWKIAQRMIGADTGKFIAHLKTFPSEINKGIVPDRNFLELKQFS